MIVRDAARATLAAGTARVWQIRWTEGAAEPTTQEEGETEFARRRTLTRVEWREDVEQPLMLFPTVWYDEPRRKPSDPTWVLDVLAHAGHEAWRGDGRYEFVTDLRGTGEAIVPPPHSRRQLPVIAGEVWLDAGGRVRRVTWRATPGKDEWTSTELWDFGTPVEIPPRPPSPSLARSIGEILWALRPTRRR